MKEKYYCGIISHLTVSDITLIYLNISPGISVCLSPLLGLEMFFIFTFPGNNGRSKET